MYTLQSQRPHRALQLARWISWDSVRTGMTRLLRHQEEKVHHGAASAAAAVAHFCPWAKLACTLVCSASQLSGHACDFKIRSSVSPLEKGRLAAIMSV